MLLVKAVTLSTMPQPFSSGDLLRKPRRRTTNAS